MPKTINHTIKKKQDAKRVRPYREEYLNFSLGGKMWVNDDYLESLGFEFVAWAKQQKHEKKPLTTLEDFYELKDIHSKVFNTWCKKNKKLMICKEQAKMILGNLRENGVNRKEFNPILIAKNMHMYKDYWKNVDKYHADLTVTANKDIIPEQKVIIIDRLQEKS